MSASSPDHDFGLPAVADAPPGNWVDRRAPASVRPFLRLMRVDRPIGTWLLLFPCWWSLALASVTQSRPYPPPLYLALFAIGAFVMRGAGCAYNDYVDRDFDARVARTASRPIPSGQVTPAEALSLVVVLSLIGLGVLLQFNAYTVWLGIASLAVVALYPFAKRFTYWPQFVLGLAFNWGALVGWSSVKGSLALPAGLLYVGSVLWTIGYDTIYAHQDREDDLIVGVKSTAIRLGEASPQWVAIFFAVALTLFAVAGHLAGAHLVYFLGLALATAHAIWQVRSLDIDDPDRCLVLFKSNRDFGLLIFGATFLSSVLQATA